MVLFLDQFACESMMMIENLFLIVHQEVGDYIEQKDVQLHTLVSRTQ